MARGRTPLPPWTPAPGDFACWTEAAYPRTGRGHLPTTRISADLGVSPSTVRRWLRNDSTGLTRGQRAYLGRRAILRGRGTYQWPQLDQDSIRRQEHQIRYAAHLAGLVDAGETRQSWRERGDLDEYWVALAWYPQAHAYAVSIGRTKKALSRIEVRAELVDVGQAAHKFAAQLRKHAILTEHLERRCVVPRELIPTGHTDALRGPEDLTLSEPGTTL